MLRRTPVKRTAAKPARRKPAFPAALVVKLWERAAGRCEARLPGCQGQATDPCHRKHRKAGGRPAGDDARLSNAWAGCRSCHDWTHARPAEANDLGLLLEEWQDPAVEPMAYQNAGLVVLDDDGGMWPFGEEAS